MSSRYSISQDADKDLDEIRDSIAGANPAAAERLLRRFFQHFDQLADYPEIGVTRDELRPGLRSVPVGNYLIFYRMVSARVEIVRVLWGGRDIERIFSRR